MSTTLEKEERIITNDDLAEATIESPGIVMMRHRMSWGAIWAGVFAICAVEIVWTILMLGIFASLIGPGGAPSGASFGAGIAAWLFVRSALVGMSNVGTAVAVATRLPIFVFVTLIVSLVAAVIGGWRTTPRRLVAGR